jgi:hypothetical protein
MTLITVAVTVVRAFLQHAGHGCRDFVYFSSTGSQNNLLQVPFSDDNVISDSSLQMR